MLTGGSIISSTKSSHSVLTYRRSVVQINHVSPEQKSVQAANTLQVATAKSWSALKTHCSCVCVRLSLIVSLHLLTLNATLACLWHQHLPPWKMTLRFVWLTSTYAESQQGHVYSVCSYFFFLFFPPLCLRLLKIRGDACREAAAERGQSWWRQSRGGGGKIQGDAKADFKIWGSWYDVIRLLSGIYIFYFKLVLMCLFCDIYQICLNNVQDNFITLAWFQPWLDRPPLIISMLSGRWVERQILAWVDEWWLYKWTFWWWLNQCKGSLIYRWKK